MSQTAEQGLEVYLVGGAVRDQRLGLPVADRDWVVVGATAEEMRRRGFKEVGRDFPVFLHPQSHEEYALARTERKTAPGYHGFVVHAAPDVTLEQDLQRRDLTINAMAETPAGELIDPFGGAQDLRDGILRHVSPAFGEDPVRILRIARFAARFAPLGFRVAHGTHDLMKQMVADGEVDALVAERVWAELEGALGERRPSECFRVLRACGALGRLMPEIDALYGVPQPAAHHPEVDTGVHALLALDAATALTDDVRVRFATLVHDLGKAATPEKQWPSHHAHERRGLEPINALCERFRVPRETRELALLVARYHSHCHRAGELQPATLLKTLEALDAFRRPWRVEQFLLACTADARGRAGHEHDPYPQADVFRRALAAATGVDASAITARKLDGPQTGEAIRQARITAIARLA